MFKYLCLETWMCFSFFKKIEFFPFRRVSPMSPVTMATLERCPLIWKLACYSSCYLFCCLQVIHCAAQTMQKTTAVLMSCYLCPSHGTGQVTEAAIWANDWTEELGAGPKAKVTIRREICSRRLQWHAKHMLLRCNYLLGKRILPFFYLKCWQ